METNLPYKVIKSEKQYYNYAAVLEELTMLGKKTKAQQEVIELLTLLIEKYDEEHMPAEEGDPVELLKFLMKENKIRAIDLAEMLGVGKSLVSDILHYRRGLSKEIIRKLSERFKVSQELFNKPYKLLSSGNTESIK